MPYTMVKVLYCQQQCFQGRDTFSFQRNKNLFNAAVLSTTAEIYFKVLIGIFVTDWQMHAKFHLKMNWKKKI